MAVGCYQCMHSPGRANTGRQHGGVPANSTCLPRSDGSRYYPRRRASRQRRKCAQLVLPCREDRELLPIPFKLGFWKPPASHSFALPNRFSPGPPAFPPPGLIPSRSFHVAKSAPFIGPLLLVLALTASALAAVPSENLLPATTKGFVSTP